ncbi:MAG: hypothetical protein ACWA5P_03640 [bacterium]
MRFHRLIIFLIVFSTLNWSYSQNKNEREFRIKEEALPTAIKETLSLFPKNTKRLKFYKEQDGEKESYEVKFKFQRQWYSVEFDTNGILEDVEVLQPKSFFKTNADSKILAYFKSKNSSFKFLRIQKQYVYDSNESLETFLIDVFNSQPNRASNFELIILEKSDNSSQLYEYVFDAKGKFISKRKVISSADEHILF